MARNRAISLVDEGEVYEKGSPGYNRALQDMFDEAQWRGSGQPQVPDEVIEHTYPDEGNVKHVYKRSSK